MIRALQYFALGTVTSFLFQYFLLGSQGWALDLYYGAAFGAAWATAYFLDVPTISLPKKLGYSFIVMGIIAGIGILLFNAPICSWLDYVCAVTGIDLSTSYGKRPES